MTEQKAKPVTKKVAATVKQPVAKKPAAKTTETAVAEPKRTKASALKKAATPVAKYVAPATKTPETKSADAKPRPTTAASKAAAQPTPEERYRMVETAAYFIAEQHGFQGRSDEHWAAAEREIAAKLGQ